MSFSPALSPAHMCSPISSPHSCTVSGVACSASDAVGDGPVGGWEWSILDMYSARLGLEPGRVLRRTAPS
eukprot:765850-Pyramimonas_sp.AAC.1